MKASSTPAACRAVRERVMDYVNQSLSVDERKIVEQHVAACGTCRTVLQSFGEVQGILRDTFDTKGVSREYSDKLNARFENMAEPSVVLAGVDAREETAFVPSLYERLGGAPWWGVSLLLHALVIALAGLISMAVSLPPAEDAVIMVTELAPRPKIDLAEQSKPKQDVENALHSKHETPPTDPTSKEVNDIVVPPDILAKAVLGDYFETVNPDRPDTQSAFGNPDAHMFHSVQGNDEPEGGGGNSGSSLEDMIGVGGASSPGSGGGWGGGHGTGIGVGTGSGRGSFGSRNGGGRVLMVKRHGGNKATENAVDAALAWLAAHQEADGHWDAVKYEGSKEADTAISSFALLAFLGAGHTEKVGKYKDNVLRAVAWLKSQQQADGGICGKGDKTGYSHGIAALAMAEAAGMANIKETKEAAQKAINYCVEIHQQGEGSEKLGWRYSPKSAGDISVTGWFVMALKSAKVAGLSVPPSAFEGAMTFLGKLENKDHFKPDGGYDNGRHRYGYTGNGLGEITQRPMRTSIGCLCQLFMGTPPSEIMGATQWFMKTEGDRGGGLPSKDKTNVYYWYYGTLVTFQVGGDEWKKWNEALKPVLTDTQRQDGDARGSWNPEKTPGGGNAWGSMWGRVGQTALSALCLEVYYRYAKLVQ